ncbi:hypothetical protein HU200_042373 [Digitaria exilis]|uniref:Phytocyanin domain-containing protein n=1 Tax=Digitaria exilis TaxID=1010633 RepID=A0A835EFY3_9POAL|nr:hypothetical protein HU200_042373 [Digitaria exilis]
MAPPPGIKKYNPSLRCTPAPPQLWKWKWTLKVRRQSRANEGAGANAAERSRWSSKIVVVFLCVMVFAQNQENSGGMVAADGPREWPVGDNSGWSLGVHGWPNYKPFKVNNLQYSLCEVPENAPVWNSGDDRITLARGVSFYISGVNDDCQNGIKIAVTAR